MYKAAVYPYIIFLFSCLIHVNVLYAQANAEWDIPANISLSKGLNTISFSLKNQNSQSLAGSFAIDVPKGLVLLGSPSIQAEIPANSTRHYMIRVLADNLSSLVQEEIKIKFLQHDGSIYQQRNVLLDIPYFRKLTLQDQSLIQSYSNPGDSLRIKIKIYNEGTTDEDVKIILASPNRYGKSVFKEIPIFLAAGKDSIISYGFEVERYMTNLPEYIINITGINQQSEPFSNLQLTFYNKSSNRDYNASNPFHLNRWQVTGNNLELRVSNLLSRYKNYSLFSFGEYNIKDGAIRYNANINHWNESHRIYINNTFIEIEKKGHSVTLGNLQEPLEASFYGRGIKYAYQDTAKGTVLEFGVTDNATELLSPLQGFKNNPYSAYSRIKLGEGKLDRKAYDGQIIINNNLFDSTSALLWTNTFDIVKHRNKNSIKGYIGAGTLQRTSSIDNEQKSSFAGGLKTNFQSGKLGLFTDYFYSTSYYPGNRRGMTQFINRLSLPLGKWQGSLGYNYFIYAPKMLTNSNTYYNTQQRLDAIFSGSIRNNIFISLSPSLNKESAVTSMLDRNVSVESKSVLMQSNVQYYTQNRRHNFNLLTEGGFIHIGNENLNDNKSRDFALRTDLNYNYRKFRLIGSLQHGSFQIYEVVNSVLFNRPIGTQYSLGAQLSGSFLGEKLRWHINSTARHSKLWGSSLINFTNIDYDMGKGTRLNLQGQVSFSGSINNSIYSYNNIQFAVRKQLPSGTTVKSPAGKLKIFAFYDNNFNGIYDNGDSPAENYTIMVGQISLSTNNKGHAYIKNIPHGKYIIFSPPVNNYIAQSQIMEILGKSQQNAQVALQQVATISGSIAISYNALFDMEVSANLAGYKIIAKSTNGTIFNTSTDDNGNYTFQIPEGTYTIYIDESTRPKNILKETREPITIDIKKTEKIVIDPFILKVKRKNIEIKRFGSN